MDVLNRSALLVRPKEPYISWAESFEDTDTVVPSEEGPREYTIYLVPEVMDDRDFELFLRKNYRKIFEHELAAWMVDESTWPVTRDYKTFRQWFDIECHSVVCDLSNEELLGEEL